MLSPWLEQYTNWGSLCRQHLQKLRKRGAGDKNSTPGKPAGAKKAAGSGSNQKRKALEYHDDGDDDSEDVPTPSKKAKAVATARGKGKAKADVKSEVKTENTVKDEEPSDSDYGYVSS